MPQISSANNDNNNSIEFVLCFILFYSNARALVVIDDKSAPLRNFDD